MSLEFIDLAAQQSRIKEKIDSRIQNVLAHGKYILGPEVSELEAELAKFSNVKHAITCGNGTDALLLALMALGVQGGETIFCPSFTFAASAEIIPRLGATPYFVDVDDQSYNLDVESLKQAISRARTVGLKPSGIIAVDLFGLPADYDAINLIAKQEGLWVVADSAQSYGASYQGRMSGAIGDVATTSFFPAKPLGCYGDGGAVFTKDDALASRIISYRFHGKGSHKYDNERIGTNSRLDTLQAAILLEKLAIYEDEIANRNRVAKRYLLGLKDTSIELPVLPSGSTSVWAQFTVKAQDEKSRQSIMSNLKAAGIPSVIYYPVPLHQQTAYKGFPTAGNGLPVSESLAKRVFSLPMHPYLDEAAQDEIIRVVREVCS